MKLKQSSDKISLKLLPIIYIVLGILCVIIRSAQMMVCIDSSTGFFTKDAFANQLLYIILAVGALTFFGCSYLSKETTCFQPENIKSNSLSVMYRVLSFTFLFTSIFSIVNLVANTSQFSMPALMQSVFSFLSGVYFNLCANESKKDDNDILKHKVLSLVPVIWAGFKLMSLFVMKISFLKVSDLAFQLFTNACLLMFFLNLAQVNSNIYRKNSIYRVFAYGLTGGLLSITTNVPKLFFEITQTSDNYINSDYPLVFTDLIFSVFILVLVIVFIKNLPELKSKFSASSEEKNFEKNEIQSTTEQI